MKQPAGQKRSAWFWVGVTLLSLSALFWLWFILTVISDPESEDGVAFVVGLMFTAIPTGIGIYSLRRSRKAQDTEAEIVSRVSDLAFWFGLLFIVFGIPIILLGLDLAGLSLGWDLIDKNLGGGLSLIGVGLFVVLIGIWIVGVTTKVTFDQPPGYLTVNLRHIPVFLWFSRTKRISGEEARTVTVAAYPVKITMKSGKELKLYVWQRDEAEPLARRILDFGEEV